MALKRPKRQKKLKETTSASSMAEECDVFNDGLDNEDCRGILLNCLKSLEKEFNYIRSLVNQNRQTQIKGEQSLANLSKSVKFIADKFDKYEMEREEKNEIITKLIEKVIALTAQKFLKKALISKSNILAKITYSSTVWKGIIMRILISLC